MADDRASVQAFLDHACEVWATNDGKKYAELFTEDGSLIPPMGGRADGKKAIGEMYADAFSTMLQGTTTTVTVDTVRAVDGDHVLVDAEQPITGPSGEVALVCHLTALLRRDGGSWKFVDGRPYTLMELPAG